MFVIKFKNRKMIIKNILNSYVSNNPYLIENYTLDDLKNKKVFSFYDNLLHDEINNFLILNKDAYIFFKNKSYIYDEKIFFNNLVRIFSLLETHNRVYNVEIDVSNRQILKDSNLLNIVRNINLTICFNNCYYTLNEYLSEEKRLEELIKAIKDANLSPYEKYLAVYNIVKNFKPYKDNLDNPKESRNLKYILDNEYMVCVGYADLLTVLLDKVGISSLEISPFVDNSYDKGFTMECTPVSLVAHRRNIIKIDDDKYNIHGIYIADSTWDNCNNTDLYNYVTVTFDEMKMALNLEKLDKLDLILDFHNINEFNKKINFYLRKYISKSSNEEYSSVIIKAYNSLYISIMYLLIKLDYEKYNELFDKYNFKIQNYIESFKNNKGISLKDIENIYSSFLMEYFQYMVVLVNQPISSEILYQALSNVKKIINNYNDTELDNWIDNTKLQNEKRKIKRFPYNYVL